MISLERSIARRLDQSFNPDGSHVNGTANEKVDLPPADPQQELATLRELHAIWSESTYPPLRSRAIGVGIQITLLEAQIGKLNRKP